MDQHTYVVVDDDGDETDSADYHVYDQTMMMLLMTLMRNFAYNISMAFRNTRLDQGLSTFSVLLALCVVDPSVTVVYQAQSLLMQKFESMLIDGWTKICEQLSKWLVQFDVFTPMWRNMNIWLMMQSLLQVNHKFSQGFFKPTVCLLYTLVSTHV